MLIDRNFLLKLALCLIIAPVAGAKTIQVENTEGKTLSIKADEISAVSESDVNSWGGVAVTVQGTKFFTSKNNLEAIYFAKPSLSNLENPSIKRPEPILVEPIKARVLPGDTVAFNHEMFGYDVFSNGEVNFSLPKNARVKIIEDAGNGGYLIEVVKEWEVNGQKKVGMIRLLDEEGDVLTSPEAQQFLIHPSDSDMKGVSIIDRGGAKAVPVTNILSVPVGNKHYRLDEEEPIGLHALNGSLREVRASVEKPNKMRISDGAYMRSGPSQNYKILDSLKKGTEVEVVESQNGWSRITNGSVKAWVHSDLLEDISSVPSPDTQKSVLLKLKGPVPRGAIRPPILSTSKNCLTFRKADYSNARVKAFIKNQRVLNAQGKTAERKREFFSFFAPFAVHLAEVSGYPASVILAQWIGETEWGASNVLEKTNNIAGYSCFKKRDSYKKETIKFAHSGEEISYSYNCNHERPKSEKGYYKGFENIIDAGYAIVYNVVGKSGTKDSYGEIRTAINNKKLSPKQKTAMVLRGLNKYATDRNYVSKISGHVDVNNLGRYDVMGTCK